MKYKEIIYGFIYPVIISIVIYYIWNIKFNIPKELQGWFMITFLSPIINSIISSNNIINGFKKFFCYFHTWNSQATPEIILWLDHYIKNNITWSQETVTQISKSKNVFWWDSNKVANLPQTREIPTGLSFISYKGKYLFVYSPFPTATTQYNKTKIDKKITIYSLTKVDWGKFIDHIRDYYYSDIASSRMIIYTSIPRWCSWKDSCLDVRPDVDRSYCFGNKAKEECWDAVIKFFSPETKIKYKKMGQIYKTSFLIHGPPGTGKSELIYLISSYLWKSIQIPIYVLTPRGMSDETLHYLLGKISSGIVIVNEFDMCIKQPLKKNKKKEDEDDDEDLGISSYDIYPSLACWHHVMESAPGEIIFWFTTNNYEKLRKINHGSLVRKGRIDHIFKFDKITDDEIKMIVKKFSPGTDLNSIPKGLTIADVIANIKFNGEFVTEDTQTNDFKLLKE